MPYTEKNLPKWVTQKLPKKAQLIWLSVWNSANNEYKDEKMAFKTAITAVKKAGYVKDDKKNKYILKQPKTSKNVGETTSSSLDPKVITESITFKKKKSLNKKEDYSKMENKQKKMSKFVKWSTGYKAKLPDSAYAIVYKEGDNKIRKLPYKDIEGMVDVPHLRNALARLPQSKLKPILRAKAMKTLQKVAKKYLKTNNTKSAKYMEQAISKYKQEDMDKVTVIIETLRKLAGNKKPEDEVHIPVKSVSYLIDDLEGIIELLNEDDEGESKDEDEESKDEESKDEESKEEPVKEDKSDESKPEDKISAESKKEETENSDSTEDNHKKETEKDGSEDKKENEENTDDSKTKEVEEDTETSKFQEMIEICEGYQTELKRVQEMVSKYQSEIETLKAKNTELNQEVSKFKQDKFTKILDETVQKVSKFKNLTQTESLELKQEYLDKKLSESALVEIGRMIGDRDVSKFSTPKQTTQPTELVNETEYQEQSQEVSKMSSSDKLDELAKIQAKIKGFVEY